LAEPLIDGNLYIIKNGEKYNIAGIKLK